MLGFGEAELESNDLAHAVRELLLWTESKDAMKFLLKERNLPDQMYTVRELQEMFLETDDPELGAVIILQLIARGAVKETADLVVSEHLQEDDPQEILILLQNSRQFQEQHLTLLFESNALASINSPDVSLKQKFKPQQEKVVHHSEDMIKISDSATDYYNRGREKHGLGQYENAIADYDNAIRLKPDHLNAYYERGHTKYILGQYQTAIVDYDTAIRLKPDHLNAYYERGLAKYILGQYQTAIADYDNAIRLKPTHLNAYYSRALAKCNLGRYAAAIVDYDNAIRFEPNDASAYYDRGLAKEKLGQYDTAISDYDTAIRLKPNDADAYYSRGIAKAKLKKYEAAIVDYDNAIHLKPDYVNAYYERGNMKYILGQDEAAIVDYDNVVRLKPDDADAYYDRALAKCNLGRYAAAVVDYDTAIRLEPDDASAYYDRGLAKDKLGQTGEAKQDWQTALKLATQAGNVKLKDEIESVLQKSADSQVEPDFKPKQEKVVDHSATQDKTSEPQVKASESLTEKEVKEIVVDYFKSLRISSPGYSVKREYLIQMGSSPRRADIVFLRNGKLVAITECKRTGRIESGHEQLKAYLCATDTFLGIFANHSDPNKWTFWENHRHNNFLEIDRETFENYVYNHDKTIKDRENKIKEEVQRGIDAEIRERVRKNTDTNAIEQNETDRIKRDVIEDIDRTAVVSSVRSQIAEQAENGLLNKRDEENYQRGLKQGIGCTIFSIIGVAILIALLIASAG